MIPLEISSRSACDNRSDDHSQGSTYRRHCDDTNTVLTVDGDLPNARAIER